MSADAPQPSPFAGFEEPIAPAPVPEHPRDENAFATLESPPNSATPRPIASQAQRRKLPWTLKLLVILVPYAVLLTVYTVYLLQNRPPHPLEAMADQGLYEDYLDGKRRLDMPALNQAESTKPRRESVDPAIELPAIPPLRLGETRRIGALDVTPVKVTRGRWTYAYKNETTELESLQKGLILHLRCKNTAKIIFHPHDPLFNRATGKQLVYTYLSVGTERFFGPINDPVRERIKGQDFTEYLPGVERETLIIAAPQAGPQGDLLAEIEKLPRDTVLTWRVQLRRGQEKVNQSDRLVWITTVLPVQFRVNDIQGLEK